MDKDKLNYFKQKLDKEKVALEQQLKNISRSVQSGQNDQKPEYVSSDTESGHDFVESSEDELEEYAVRSALSDHLKKQLDDVKLALEKIKNGNYGLCENCNAQIPLERLEIQPWARLCFNCGAS